MAIGDQVGKAAVDDAVAGLQQAEQAAIPLLADAVSNVVGAVDRLGGTLAQQSAAWLTEAAAWRGVVTTLTTSVSTLLTKGLKLTVNE
jgi:hypothetical protein